MEQQLSMDGEDGWGEYRFPHYTYRAAKKRRIWEHFLVLFWFGIFNSTGLEEERFCVVWYKIFIYEENLKD